MVFLDVKKKVWIIKDLEIPVIEDVPMKEMKWFREKIKDVVKHEEDQDLTQTAAMEVDDEWWEKTCQIGLGVDTETIMDTGISEPDFRELMQEVYNFLANCGTIEKAKLSVIYDPEILKKEQLAEKTTQN